MIDYFHQLDTKKAMAVFLMQRGVDLALPDGRYFFPVVVFAAGSMELKEAPRPIVALNFVGRAGDGSSQVEILLGGRPLSTVRVDGEGEPQVKGESLGRQVLTTLAEAGFVPPKYAFSLRLAGPWLPQ